MKVFIRARDLRPGQVFALLSREENVCEVPGESYRRGGKSYKMTPWQVVWVDTSK